MAVWYNEIKRGGMYEKDIVEYIQAEQMAAKKALETL